MEAQVISPDLDNVFFDNYSTYKWENLDERNHLISTLKKLKILMDNDFNKYDFFIYACRNRVGRRPNSSTPSSVGYKDKVLIFTSDENSTYPREEKNNYKAIFKYFLPYQIPGDNIFPLPLGTANATPIVPITPMEYRTIDVFFSGQLTSSRLNFYREFNPNFIEYSPKLSKIILKIIKSSHLHSQIKTCFDLSLSPTKAKINFTLGYKQGLTPHEFSETLSKSKIALCPRGWKSPETFRHYEAARAGSVIISEKLPKTHFLKDAPFVICKDWNEGIQLAKNLAQDSTKLEELQRETLEWFKSYCQNTEVAKFMKKCLNSIKN